MYWKSIRCGFQMEDTQQGAAILTAAGLFVGYTCFGAYHMEWTTANETQDPACEEIKAHLLSLGFPEDILHDLKEEDILACKNARQVLLNQSDDLLRDGDGRLQLDGGSRTGTGRPVEGDPSFLMEWKSGLSRDRSSTDQSGISGTERGLDLPGELTGQVLYDKDGTSYTADYASCRTKHYDTGQNFPFYGSQQYASIFAEFSLPRSGENCRGYVAYEIKAKEKVTGGLIPG